MKFSLFLLLCVLTGCAHHTAPLPAVSGTPEPVNSPSLIQELTRHV
ncbi:hypothetical protein [Sodalis sp. RH16]|jgi:hypothetical protein